ncbi:MAG: Mov34/MPN/PAD-1 family protein [Promethearchaeota archaeon]
MPREKNKQGQDVVIKSTAYLTMMKHVLRFGSNALQKHQCRECMGMLIGRLDGDADEKGIKQVIIEEAVPVSHGGSIEVKFRPQDYVAFSEIDAGFLEKGWFTVGWYHSHPGLTCFFSSTDIINQLGWQNANPSAIGIVWDHQRLFKKGDMGFEIYRLDNPSLGPASGYHKIPFTVEVPSNLDFFSKGIVDTMTSFQSHMPPIFEINEVPQIFKKIQFPKVQVNLPQTIDGLIGSLLQHFQTIPVDEFKQNIALLIHELSKHTQNYSQKVASADQYVLVMLQSLLFTLNQAVGAIQNWYENSMREFLQNIDRQMKNMIAFNTKQKVELTGKLNAILTNIDENLSRAFDREIKKSLNEISQRINIIVDKYMKIGQQSRIAASEIAIQKQDTDDLFNQFKQKIVHMKSSGVQTVAATGSELNQELVQYNSTFTELENEVESINKRLATISKNLKKWRRK